MTRMASAITGIAGMLFGVPATVAAQTAVPAESNLVRTGFTTYEHIEAGRGEQGFWFRTEPWYTVTLFLPRDQASRFFEPFRAATLEAAVKKEGLGNQIIGGGVDKVVELTMLRDVTSKSLRTDFNERLGKQIRVSSPEMDAFDNCLKTDLREGDKVRIDVSASGVISVTTGGRTCADNPSQRLATAMLGLWIGYDGSPKSAKQMASLFADVRSMLEQGTAAAVDKPVEAGGASQPAAEKPRVASTPAPKADASRSDVGVLVCRKGNQTLRLTVPAGALEKVRELAAQMGYPSSSCQLTPE